jgi:hypothetical protein
MQKGSKALTDKGFVPIAYTAGVMVADATAPGKTAADTGSGGGPYARALAEELIKPGVIPSCRSQGLSRDRPGSFDVGVDIA